MDTGHNLRRDDADMTEGVRFIGLQRGLFALVDARDFDWLSRQVWTAMISEALPRIYAARNDGNRRIWMHREIIGCSDDLFTDHVNGFTLDNRRSNLREATSQQNMANTRKRLTYRGRPASSLYKGVHWSKAGKTWAAVIHCLGKQKWLGGFATEEDAALAYDTAAKQIFGEFAHLNFPNIDKVHSLPAHATEFIAEQIPCVSGARTS